MAGDGAVRRLILVYAVRGDENARHQAKAAESGSDHVAHHVAVIIFACPNEASLGTDHTGHSVIDQRIEVFNACGVEFLLILRVEDLLENILEAVIVFLGNGVLGGKPQILLGVERVIEARSRKAANAVVKIMLSLYDAGPLELMDQFARLGAVGSGHNKLRTAACGYNAFRIAVNVAVGVTGNGDRFLPAGQEGDNPVDKNGCTENRSVQDGADGTVRRFPHLVQIVFLYPGCIGGNGGAFDGDAVFFGCLSAFRRDTVGCFVAVFQAQIIIFRFEVDVRGDQNLLEHFPDDSRHLIAVHFYERRFHLNFIHDTKPPDFSQDKGRSFRPRNRFHGCS